MPAARARAPGRGAAFAAQPSQADPQNTVYLETKDGRVTIRLRAGSRAEARGADQDPDQAGLLQRRRLPPGDRGLHGPDGRPDRHRHGQVRPPNLPAEFTPTPYKRGSVGMARSQSPDPPTAVLHLLRRLRPLTGQYTLVGEVVAGMDVVDKIKKGDRRQRRGDEPRQDREDAARRRRQVMRRLFSRGAALLSIGAAGAALLVRPGPGTRGSDRGRARISSPLESPGGDHRPTSTRSGTCGRRIDPHPRRVPDPPRLLAAAAGDGFSGQELDDRLSFKAHRRSARQPARSPTTTPARRRTSATRSPARSGTLERCTPLPFTARSRAAIAGRHFTIRFIDTRPL